MAIFKLSFMTWCAPEWDLQAIVDGAHKYGYDGAELRVESGHKHGLELDTPAGKLQEARELFHKEGLKFSAVATGLRFSDPDEQARKTAIENCKKYVDFAKELGAPYIRVFGGNLPDGTEVAAVVDYVAEALDECVEAAEGSGVNILIETHDAFSNTRYVREVCKQLYTDQFGVVWDVAHPLRQLETLEEAYDNISSHVRHIHIHDLAYSDDRTKTDFCACGEGFVRHDRAIEFLAQDGFEGYLSLELMNVDPDEVLPQYAEKLNRYIDVATGDVSDEDEDEAEEESSEASAEAAASGGA